LAETTLIVSAATLVSVALTPSNGRMALGTTQQFTLTGTYSRWFVAGLDLLGGLELFESGRGNDQQLWAGEPGRSGEHNDYSAERRDERCESAVSTLMVSTATLVSINIGPVSLSLAKGLTVQLAVTAIFSDGTTQDVTSLSA
jgi:hypothetical protein